MDQLRTYPHPCEFEAITAAVVAACDELDGSKDGIISRVDLCDFDPPRRRRQGDPVRWRRGHGIPGPLLLPT